MLITCVEKGGKSCITEAKKRNRPGTGVLVRADGLTSYMC
jgi:hypothetical protein